MVNHNEDEGTKEDADVINENKLSEALQDSRLLEFLVGFCSQTQLEQGDINAEQNATAKQDAEDSVIYEQNRNGYNDMETRVLLYDEFTIKISAH